MQCSFFVKRRRAGSYTYQALSLSPHPSAFRERKDPIRGCCGFVYPLVFPLRQLLFSTLSGGPWLLSFLPHKEKKMSGIQRSGGDLSCGQRGRVYGKNQLGELHFMQKQLYT